MITKKNPLVSFVFQVYNIHIFYTYFLCYFNLPLNIAFSMYLSTYFYLQNNNSQVPKEDHREKVWS